MYIKHLFQEEKIYMRNSINTHISYFAYIFTRKI